MENTTEPSVEQKTLSGLIAEAIRVLCQNGLTYNAGFAVEGVLQVITDNKQVFRIDIEEVIGMTSEALTSLKQEMNIPEQETFETVYIVETGKGTSLLLNRKSTIGDNHSPPVAHIY